MNLKERTILKHIMLMACCAIIALGYLNCSPPGQGYSTSPTAAVDTAGTFRISPSYTTVSGGAQFTFTAVGGQAPYTFRITSGQGTLNPTTGAYTAPTTSQLVYVQAIDANNLSAIATINVNTLTAVTGATPNPVVGFGLDCSPIAFEEYQIASDGTGSGHGEAVGTSTQTSVNSCVTYCNSMNAGYCEWNQSNNLCAAWAQNASITFFATSSPIFGGTCECNPNVPNAACNYIGTPTPTPNPIIIE